MKNISQFVIVGVLLALGILVQNNLQAQNTSLKYKVQVGAFRNPSAVSFQNLYSIGEVYAEDAGNGLTRIVLGYYADKSTAKTILNKAKKKGYKDAFIGLNKASIKKETLTPKQKEAAKKSTPTPPVKKKAETKAPPPKKKAEKLAANQAYVIELGQYDQLSSIPNLALVNSLGDVYLERRDNTNRVLLGTFSDRKKANETLAKVRKAGFKEAGLRILEKDKNNLDNKKEESKTTSNPPLLIYEGKNKKNTKGGPTNSMIELAMVEVNKLFQPLDFEVFSAGVYNPSMDITAEPVAISDNAKLKGKKIPINLIGVFDKSWRADPKINYYGVGRFAITPTKEAYLVRKGRDDVSYMDNQIMMYIFDKVNQKLAGQELLSSLVGSEGFYSQTQSWLIDMNNDQIPDILSYYTEEYYTTSGESKNTKKVTAKVWLDGKYIDAQIVNEEALKQQLGL